MSHDLAQTYASFLHIVSREFCGFTILDGLNSRIFRRSLVLIILHFRVLPGFSFFKRLPLDLTLQIGIDKGIMQKDCPFCVGGAIACSGKRAP